MAAIPMGNGVSWDPSNFGSPLSYTVADVTRPTYTPGYDPKTMSMVDALDPRLAKLNMNTAGLDEFRQEALRKGPSAWAKLTNTQSYANEADARERAKLEAKHQQAGAESSLAMNGGLSSGARERVARSGSQNLLDMSAATGRQGDLNRMQVGINDEQNRVGQLSQLPGMETQNFNSALQKEQLWDNAKNTDVNRITAENNQRMGFNMDLYQEQMRDRAAAMQANATMQSGGKK